MKEEKKRTDLTLSIAGFRIRFLSDVPLAVPANVAAFCVSDCPNSVGQMVRVRTGRIRVPALKKGQDLTMDYGVFKPDGSLRFAAARMHGDTTSLLMLYSPDFSEITVWLNTEEFDYICRMDKILQYFPIRGLLLRYNALMLHASRIMTDSRAIVFTAPSGTGKTTQAKLWERERGAEIVSNDRTILRKTAEGTQTCGYPVDGSSPVYSTELIPLGAIVILRQGKENRVEELTAGTALAALLGQTARDSWDAQEMTALQLLWLDILSECPVLRLTCRPVASAVDFLEEKLKELGVLDRSGKQWKQGGRGFGRES